MQRPLSIGNRLTLGVRRLNAAARDLFQARIEAGSCGKDEGAGFGAFLELNSMHIQPEAVCQLLEAVRCMATLTGNKDVSLRISLVGEECLHCHRDSETFIEPAHVCANCWSVLVLNVVSDSLKRF